MTVTDPFETQNMESALTKQEKLFLHETLNHMKSCKGKSCILPRKHHIQVPQENEEPSNNISGISTRGSKRKHGRLKKIVFTHFFTYLHLFINT